jgi:hypothetical protein
MLVLIICRGGKEGNRTPRWQEVLPNLRSIFLCASIRNELGGQITRSSSRYVPLIGALAIDFRGAGLTRLAQLSRAAAIAADAQGSGSALKQVHRIFLRFITRKRH